MSAAEDPGLARVTALLERRGNDLLALAAASIRYPLAGHKLVVRPEDVPAELAAPGASFITLMRDGELRGCVGSHRAWRPLVTDVIENAAAAAFQEPRFPPLMAKELAGLALSVSLLTPSMPVPAASEAELLLALRPGRDGVILIDGAHRGLFLPVMWEQLPRPEEFMRWLKRKAGLPETHWSSRVRISRFETKSVQVDDIAEIGEPAFAPRVG
ncbi:MAG: AmmeMemoRadiSam system protein A [Alphaproteobacteria bacterium]|nr:AmmeMemoRadiSam system protein A [Alphaproteobacteria bacterium]